MSQILTLLFLVLGGIILGLIYLTLGKFSKSFTTRKGRLFYMLIRSIPLIASILYLVMFISWGFLDINISFIHKLRLFDWLITTPLIIGLLGYIAHKARFHWSILLAAFLDIYMIATGFVDDIVNNSSQYWIFISGMIAFFIMTVMLVLWYIGLKKDRKQASKELALFRRLLRVIIISWSAYPIIFVLGVAGYGFFDYETEVGLYMVLDIFSKGMFVFLIATDEEASKSMGMTKAEKVDETLFND